MRIQLQSNATPKAGICPHTGSIHKCSRSRLGLQRQMDGRTGRDPDTRRSKGAFQTLPGELQHTGAGERRGGNKRTRYLKKKKRFGLDRRSMKPDLACLFLPFSGDLLCPASQCAQFRVLVVVSATIPQNCIVLCNSESSTHQGGDSNLTLLCDKTHSAPHKHDVNL